MEIVISFALALSISTVLVPFLMKMAPAIGLVDRPDGDRKVHDKPVPRCGGLSIAIAVIIPAMLWLREVSSLLGFFIGAAIIVVFGFFDDRHELNFKWKFLGQILAVSVFLMGDLVITKTPFMGLGDLLPWLSYPVIALFIVGVINAVNMSDGLDGLAAGSSLLSLVFIAFLGYFAGEYSLMLVAVATCGALLGFLRFNTHPATVFMGDTGSQFLGYVAACLAIMVTQSDSLPVSPMVAILVVGLPILDTLSVMLLRMRDGQSPFQPDKRHLHHQFLAVGMQHYQAVAALYLLNFLLLGLCYFVRYQSDIVVFLSYLLFCATTLALIGFLKHSAPVRKLRLEQRADRRNQFFRKLDWYYHNGPLVIQCLMGAVWIACIWFSVTPVRMPLPVIIVILVLIAVLWVMASKASIFNRIIFYLASLSTLFLASYESNLAGWQFYVDAIIGILVILLVLSMRMTRREEFSLDTQDILIVLLLVLAPLLSFGFGDSRAVIDDVMRLAILLYASEYLVSRFKSLGIARLLAILALVLVVFRSLT